MIYLAIKMTLSGERKNHIRTVINMKWGFFLGIQVFAAHIFIKLLRI